jgi:hypothetical protein
MSYSITATRPSKAELETVIRDELVKVRAQQPVHEADIDQAFDAAKSLLDLLQGDPPRDVCCSISGSIWKTEAGVQSVSMNISLSHVDRK